MPAPKGNQFWKLRGVHGRNPLFKDKDELWEACCKYFEWVVENPVVASKLVSFQGESVLEPVPMMRAMTFEGLCIHTGMTLETWSQYRKKEDFSEVAQLVDNIIREQKFTGAAAGLLNANIIARDLGLKEESTHALTGADGGPIETADMSEREIARRIAFLFKKGLIEGEKSDEGSDN